MCRLAQTKQKGGDGVNLMPRLLRDGLRSSLPAGLVRHMFRSFDLLAGYFKALFAFHDGVGLVKSVALVLSAVLAYAFRGEAESSAAVGVGILMVFDLGTGVIAAVKEGRAVTSRALFQTGAKVFDYCAVVAVAAVVEHTILYMVNLPVVTGVLWLMIATEGLSILENVRRCGYSTRFAFLEKVLDGVHRTEGNPADQDK